MSSRLLLVVLFVTCAVPAWAQAPAAGEAALYEKLRDPDPQVRALAEQGLWRMWMRSGDTAIDEDLERGTFLMQTGSVKEAIDVFSAIVRLRPDFAEGWNRRATAYYFAGEDEKSISDCREVLKRNPRHFGALSGMGLLHMRRGDLAGALHWFRRALEVNPNLDGVRENIRQIEALQRRRST